MSGSVPKRKGLVEELASLRNQGRAGASAASAVARRTVSLPAIEWAYDASSTPGSIYAPLTLWTPASLSTLSVALFIGTYYPANSIRLYVRAEWHSDPWSQAELDANLVLNPKFEPSYLLDSKELPLASLAQKNGVTQGATVAGVTRPNGLTFAPAVDVLEPTATALFRGSFAEQPANSLVRLALVGQYGVVDGVEFSMSTNVMLAVASGDGRV
jgi:hypothetical protein